MNPFDFNNHFNQYNSHLFFNEKSYTDLLCDVSSNSNLFLPYNSVGLKIKSPYWTFVALLICLKEKKLAILFSSLETDSMIESLYTQVHFDTIIEDHHFIKTSLPNNSEISKNIFSSIDFNTAFLVLFSSGTTAFPKGIAFCFNNLYYSAKGFSDFFHQTNTDLSLINLPHHHVAGLMILWRAFFTGGPVTTEINSSLDFISLVPQQLKRMIEDVEKRQLLSKIRVILVGGARLSIDLREQAKLHNLNLYETYGMTETTSLLMVNGKVLPYREVELNEEDIFITKGKTLALGHYQENIFYPIESGWFKTNDLGYKDEQGKFNFLGRKDIVFVCGGENINPLLIEDKILQHPLIEDAYVVPLQDEFWGQIGILLYKTKPGQILETAEIKTFLKTHLHPHLIPKLCFNTNFNLSGKIKVKRSELIETAEKLYLLHIFSFDYKEVKDTSTVIFFHGFMGDKEDLKNISAAIQIQYSTLHIDLPGHGKTKVSNFYSTTDFFLKLKSFINLFSHNPIYYGYSMGGRIALHLALNYLVPKYLILESVGLGLITTEEQLLRQVSDVEQFSGLTQDQLPEFIEHWYQNPIFNNFYIHPVFQTELIKKSKHDFKEWRDSQKIISSGHLPLFKDNLLKINLIDYPLVYIYGEDDIKYKNFGQLLKLLTKSSLVTIIGLANSSHNPNKTHPTEITKHLTNLLK